MQKELECKLLLEDVEALKTKLIEKGAVLIGHEKQKNTVIDSKDHPIVGKSYLRIRTVKDYLNDQKYCELTYKEKVITEGIREYNEYTTKINSENEMLRILEKLGFNLVQSGIKERISYQYKDARFDFDYWDKDTYPYPYVEIEVQSKEMLDHFIQELNIDPTKISLLSIKELQDQLKR